MLRVFKVEQVTDGTSAVFLNTDGTQFATKLTAWVWYVDRDKGQDDFLSRRGVMVDADGYCHEVEPTDNFIGYIDGNMKKIEDTELLESEFHLPVTKIKLA